MWLLSTDRAELHEFASPEAVQGGYAILSHVWDDGEQSFQVTQTLREVCTKTGANPRDLSQPKIRFACILAESHGFEWLWVDTSCIDKSSSADLSESINSMYRYYSLANICYAYLPDVPPGPVSARSPFARSKWHTRGWTLQELIAPTFVLFLATNWTIIGTKAELADILEAITRVPAELLKMRARLVDYSVAQRMSWAASRKTKRVEDQAYCLLGIFGISMSTLYGEGEQAFYRLQEEIMKRFVDTTIFAWGSPSNLIPSNPGPVLHQLALPNNAPRPPETYLLAPNADAFKACRGITYNPPSHDYHHVPGKFRRTLHNREHSGTPTFSITPHGVLAHIPLIEDWDEYSDEVTAYLFWSSSIHRNAPLGLRLKRSPTSADPLRPHYDVVAERLVRLTWDAEGRIAIGGAPVHLSWQEIYITHRPPPESAIHEHANKLFVSLNLGYSVPFRINNKDIDNLPDSPWPMALTRCTNMPELPWDGSPPITLQLDLLDRDLELRTCFAMLSLGRCTSKRAHWACLQFTQRSVDRIISDDDDLGHDCGVDHIEAWMDRSKTFEFQPEEVGLSTTVIQGPHGPSVYRSSVTLKFNTCPLNPQNTLIMNILTT
ncbi:hypothetical protein BD311DRAFT_313844 [Dichomitus squalens]|uniref:Uncharacterized protein n=1 Tax=Dichomitus squalens TaxID=114155 RepID=A0A4Q9MQG5_9APHY|nr:hypothetical protein BD311DRAFT_313844 [Dichomitus squalens]